MFRRIQPKEFLNQAWNDPKKLELAPNITTLIERFNWISLLISTIIVKLRVSAERAQMIKKFIQTAEHCLELRNYNTLMEIVSGLSSAPIGRLKQTWEGVPAKYHNRFHDLESTTSTDKNFKTLRHLTTNVPPPKIPYLGIPLADLTFIEDGNPDTVQSKAVNSRQSELLINFTKRQLLTTVIMEMQTCQQQPYQFKTVGVLRDYLLAFPVLPGQQVYEYSLKREPRAVGGSWSGGSGRCESTGSGMSTPAPVSSSSSSSSATTGEETGTKKKGALKRLSNRFTHKALQEELEKMAD